MDVSIQAIFGLAAAGTGIAGTVCAGVMFLIRTETRNDITRLDGRIARQEAVCQANHHAELDWRNALVTRLDRMDAKLDKALGID